MTSVTFGRAGAPGQTVAQPVFIESATAHGAALGERSRLVGTISDILLFVGLVSVLLLVVYMPPDPTCFPRLSDMITCLPTQSDVIIIPAALSEIAAFSDPPLKSIPLSEVSHVAFDYAGITITVAGLIAVIRRRWLFVIAAALFLIFPWSFFGFSMKMAAGCLSILGVVSAVKLISHRSKWFIVGAVAVAIVFPGPALLLVGSISTLVPRMQEHLAPYHTVQFDKLKKAEARLAGGEEAPGVIGTLANLRPKTDAERSALGFAMAQEFVLRGKLPEAAEALRFAKGKYPNKGALDEKMISAFENHLSALGALGATAKTNVMKEYRRQFLVWRMYYIPGELVLLLGFAIDILAYLFRRRSQRLDRLSNQLVTAPVIPSLGSEPRLLSPTSFSLLDAEKVVEQLSGRMRIYRFALIVFGVAAAIAMCIRYIFKIPDAASNTTFGDVALVSSQIASFVNKMSEGAVSRVRFNPFDEYEYYIIGGMIVLGVGMLLFRKTRVYVLPAVAVLFTFSIASSLAIQPVHTPTAARELFTQEVRVALAKAIDAPLPATDMDNKSVYRMRFNVTESFNSLAIEMMENEDGSGNQAANKTIVMPSSTAMKPERIATLLGHAGIEPNSAAFALLQLAYLDNDALMAAKHLRTLDAMPPPKFLFARERIDIVREWASTHGQTVEPTRRAQLSTMPLTTMRWIAEMAGFALAGLLMIGAIPLAMMLFAWNRKRQIEQLSDRHRQEFSLLAS